MTHPLTNEMIESISCFYLSKWGDTGEGIKQDMRAAYDRGYADALEDIQDVLTCIQRKDSTPMPTALHELKAMRPQQQEDN